MHIDITSRDGANILTVLGHATKMMREAGASSEVITALRRTVIGAPNIWAARRAITRITNGGVTFYDPRD